MSYKIFSVPAVVTYRGAVNVVAKDDESACEKVKRGDFSLATGAKLVSCEVDGKPKLVEERKS